MEKTDWKQVHMQGMNGYEEVIKRHESALLELQAEVLELRATLPVAARMETVWFRRYVVVMLALLNAGLPEDTEPERVGEWLASRSGNGDGGAMRGDNGTGNGMDSDDAPGMQHMSFRCDGGVRLDPPMEIGDRPGKLTTEDRCGECNQGR